MFKKKAEVKMRLVDPRKERTADHFDPKPIPSRIALQRPWPRISGSEVRLRYCIGHLTRVAHAAIISIVVLDKGLGGAGRYDSASAAEHPNGCIYVAAEVMDDPALYAVGPRPRTRPCAGPAVRAAGRRGLPRPPLSRRLRDCR